MLTAHVRTVPLKVLRRSTFVHVYEMHYIMR